MPDQSDAAAVSTMSDEERELLRSTVRDLVQSRGTSERVRHSMMRASGVDDDAWRDIAAAGLVGIAIPEPFGAGASFLETAFVVEELGRKLVPVPFLSSAILGAIVLGAAGSDRQRQTYLPDVAGGSVRLALAHLDERADLEGGPGVTATRNGDVWVLDGASGCVVDGHTADVLLVAAAVERRTELFLVEGETKGVKRSRLDVLDLTRPMADVRLDGVTVTEEARLSGGDPMEALADALASGAAALAVEQMGGAQHVVEMTAEYARERLQFGRPIGSFQAVKHRLAEMLMYVEAGRSVADQAVRSLADGDRTESAIAVPMAKAYCSEVYERVTADAVQIFGGIGFTWEHDIHLYFKRAKSSKLLLGEPRYHRRRLGEQLGV